MEAIIEKQFKQFYKNIFNQCLQNMKEGSSQERSPHLVKAKEALSMFIKHVDDYMAENLKPKLKTTKQPKKEMIQANQIESQIKLEQQQKQSKTIISPQKPSEQKILLSSVEPTNQKKKINESLFTTASLSLFSQKKNTQTSVGLFGSAPKNDKISCNLFSNIYTSSLFPSTCSNNSSILFPSASSNLLQPRISSKNAQTLFSSPSSSSLFAFSNTSSNNTSTLFSHQSNISSNQSIFSSSNCDNKSLASTLTNISVQKETTNNNQLILPVQPNPFLKKINPATKQIVNSSFELNYNPQQSIDSVEITTQKSLFESVVSETSEDDLQVTDTSIYHYHHLGKFLQNKLKQQTRQYYLQVISQYYPSNYFHVGPRYQLLDFLCCLANMVESQEVPKISSPFQINQALIKLGQKISNYISVDKIINIRSINQQYSSSNYFHVGPRRTMLQYVRQIVNITKNELQNI